MFNNATVYEIKLPQPMLVQTLDDALKARAHQPIGKSEPKSAGWAPVRGFEHGALVESIDGHLIMRFITETKRVPAQVIKEAVDAQCKALEQTTGRKPGKKERREIKEAVVDALLAQAFATSSSTWVWIDAERGLLIVDTTSQSVIDDIIGSILYCAEGALIGHPKRLMSPRSFMASMLLEDEVSTDLAEYGFFIGRSCELIGAEKTKVRYTNHSLETDEIKNHLRTGKEPVKLSLVYDGRLKFTLGADGEMSGLTYLSPGEAPDAADAFDANVILATGELRPAIKALLDALNMAGGAV